MSPNNVNTTGSRFYEVYCQIKESYKDSVILLRLGDFYEALDEDAWTVATALELTVVPLVVGKGLSVPMAGFPVGAVEEQVKKLIEAGHQVAIAEVIKGQL